MICSEASARLGEFLCGALDEADDMATALHLERCEACSRELGTFGALDTGLREGGAALPGARRGLRRALSGAVALVAVSVLVLILIPEKRSVLRLRYGAIASPTGVHRAGDSLPADGALRALDSACVELPRSHVFDPASGACFRIGSGGDVVLTRGAADVVAAKGSNLSVTTPLGVVEASDAAFRVSIEESAMNRTAARASALVVTVAVVGGTIYFVRDRGVEGPTSASAPAELVARPGSIEVRPATRQAASMMPAAESRSTQEALTAVTRERDELKAKLDDLHKSMLGLEETNKRLTALVDPLRAKAADEDAESGRRLRDVPKTAKELADLLGLDEARQNDFDGSYNDIVKKMKALEAAKATVTVVGDVTTIEVPAFEDEGKDLTNEWNGWLDRNLSAAERAKYDKHDMAQNLFHAGIGVMRHTITIHPEGTGVTIEDRARGRGMESWVSANGSDVDSVIGRYRHLLPNR